MGICWLGAGRKHRRIDIKMYPRIHFAPALLYFTGSKHFGASMRLFALRKGLTLTNKGIFPLLRIKQEKVWRGREALPLYTEKEIFDCLNLPYREPHERDFD